MLSYQYVNILSSWNKEKSERKVAMSLFRDIRTWHTLSIPRTIKASFRNRGKGLLFVIFSFLGRPYDIVCREIRFPSPHITNTIKSHVTLIKLTLSKEENKADNMHLLASQSYVVRFC